MVQAKTLHPHSSNTPITNNNTNKVPNTPGASHHRTIPSRAAFITSSNSHSSSLRHSLILSRTLAKTFNSTRRGVHPPNSPLSCNILRLYVSSRPVNRSTHSSFDLRPRNSLPLPPLYSPSPTRHTIRSQDHNRKRNRLTLYRRTRHLLKRDRITCPRAHKTITGIQ
jgi:hypothetical protein